jgi:hypothetical protein
MEPAEDEDMIDFIKKANRILKKHPANTNISINEPGKITRFKKEKPEKKQDKLQSAWLVQDEAYGNRE